MNTPEAPKIEFPCRYPIKIVGRQCDHFDEVVLEIFSRHAPDFDGQMSQRKTSREGTFCSVTITIEATGEQQLTTIHTELMATGFIKMVI